ncbi:hypothetical protein BGX21_006338 [Mortierella sp. AD011]|nr:hypothetical protein BGX21_006338 [Mortierella sp. AD011]
MARGRFILLEGCDRAGKSTQCSMLVSALKARGHAVELCKFPDRTTTIGKMIHAYLTNAQELDDKAGLDLTWCKNPDRGLIRPDVTFFLDLPTSEAERRGGFGEERYEKRELQEKVRDVFLKLQSKEWVMIDACKSVEAMHHEILKEAEHKIQVAEADAKLAEEDDVLVEDMFQD